MSKYFFGVALSVISLTACTPQQTAVHQEPEAQAITEEADSTPASNQARLDAAKLDAVLADPRREKDRARDIYRHTAKTMAFFDIAPDANVVEVLPGGGWYTRVLLPYISPDGGWYGINYSTGLRKGILEYAGRENIEENLAEYAGWPQRYPETAAKNGPPNGAVKGAMLFGEVPQSDYGQMDAVVFIRALHHLNRIDPKFLEEAITDSFNLLKPGGVVGVVQHRAKESYGDMDYDTSGHKGYVKQSYIIAMFEKGGFVLDGQSEINANPKDTADYERGVWTLPPSLRGKDEAMQEHYIQIGESDRMTLRFRKPS